MPWKTQEVEIDGQKVALVTVDQAGNPIWVDEKGMETGQDVVRLRAQLTDANKEAADFRVKLKTAEEAAAAYEGVDLEEAKKAMETVKNFKDKEFIEADKVKQLKDQAVEEVNRAWQTKYDKMDEAYRNQLTEVGTKIAQQDQTVRNLMVRGAFEGSEFIKTAVAENYFPEVLYTMFGSNFEVRPGENGSDPVVVAKVNGEEIYSPANPRQFATPEEAIEILVRAHPHSKSILRGSGASGSGATGGAGSGPVGKLQEMKNQYQEAKKVGNVPTMVALKNEIFKQDPSFTG